MVWHIKTVKTPIDTVNNVKHVILYIVGFGYCAANSLYTFIHVLQIWLTESWVFTEQQLLFRLYFDMRKIGCS